MLVAFCSAMGGVIYRPGGAAASRISRPSARGSPETSAAGPARPQGGPALPLAHAHGIRCHLDQLVLVDPGEGILETHGVVRNQADRLVVSRGAHVGELLLAADVHV